MAKPRQSQECMKYPRTFAQYPSRSDIKQLNLLPGFLTSMMDTVFHFTNDCNMYDYMHRISILLIIVVLLIGINIATGVVSAVIFLAIDINTIFIIPHSPFCYSYTSPQTHFRKVNKKPHPSIHTAQRYGM